MPRRYDLPGQLINHAQGLHAASAAVELLCAHGTWLGKPAFVSRCAITGTHPSGGLYAYIDWSNAIAALDAGHLAGSGSENNILRIAASIGDPGIPVQLACVLGNLDPPTSAWSPQPSSAPTAVTPATASTPVLISPRHSGPSLQTAKEQSARPDHNRWAIFTMSR